MKIRRLIQIILLIIAMAAVLAWLLIRSQHSQSFRSLPKLSEAMQNYSHDLVSHGQSLPTSVTLQDLINHGYISAGEVRDLNGADVTFYPSAANSADPQTILIRVRMSGRMDTIVLADGSIQQLAR